MKNTKLLFVTRSYLFQNNGGAIASRGFVHAFAALYEKMWLVYPESNIGQSDEYIPACVVKIPCQDKRPLIIKGLDVYRGRILRFYNPVVRLLEKEKFDVVVIDGSLTSLGFLQLAKNMNIKIITIHHNVEIDYLKANPISPLYSLPYHHYVKKAEKDSLIMSDLNLVLTKEDGNSFMNMYPNKNLHIHTIGVFEYRKSEKIISNKNSKNRDITTFVISGSLYFSQSEMPILDFIKQYWPILKSKVPNAELIITGRNPSELLADECKKKGVRLVPNPDVISEIIAQGDFYICPINTGSGLKLRLLDGLKQGLPVIAHSVSVRGYDALKDKVVFEYNDKRSFVLAVEKMMNSNILKSEVYEAYREIFCFEEGTNRIQKALISEKLL